MSNKLIFLKRYSNLALKNFFSPILLRWIFQGLMIAIFFIILLMNLGEKLSASGKSENRDKTTNHNTNAIFSRFQNSLLEKGHTSESDSSHATSSIFLHSFYLIHYTNTILYHVFILPL